METTEEKMVSLNGPVGATHSIPESVALSRDRISRLIREYSWLSDFEKEVFNNAKQLIREFNADQLKHTEDGMA